MQFQRLILGLILVASIIACVPTLSSYHSAESHTGDIISAPCSPDDAWKINIQDVSLEVYPWGGTLGIMFRIPESYIVEIQSANIKIWINSQTEPILIPIKEFTVINPGERERDVIKPSEQLVGETARILGIKANRIFNATLEMSHDLNDIVFFKIEVPKFKINNSEYGGDIVRFKKSEKPWLAPVNC